MRFLPNRALAAALLAVSTLAALPAAAEPLTVSFQFDRASLETPAGARSTLADLVVQAERACEYAVPVTGQRRLDETCRTDALTLALAEINDARLDALAAPIRTFAAATSIAP